MSTRNQVLFCALLLVVISMFHWRADKIRIQPGYSVTNEVADYDREVNRQSTADPEIVVDLVDNLDISQIRDLEKKIGEDIVAESEAAYTPHRIMVVHLKHHGPGRLKEVLSILKADKRVEVAEPNGIMGIPEQTNTAWFPIDVCEKPSNGEPNDPLFKYQWHMKMIHVTEAWKVTQGAGVTVAIIDTGVTHTGKIVEDLRGVEFVKPYNFVDKTENANDDHGHGTHVACTVAEQSNNALGGIGVAPKVRIMPLKVLNRYGSGTWADITASILYAADNGANVINMSLGGDYRSDVMEAAVDYATKKGVLVVCAAGNSGPRKDTVGYPAGYKNAVSVSSVDSVGGLAWYSSWGKKVDIAAPGGDTRSDKNGDGKPDGVLQNTIVPSDKDNMSRYELFQGTSMASPHAAGVAALVYSTLDQADRNPKNVLRIMQLSAQKKDDAEKFGAGVVDAFASVQIAKMWPYLKALQEANSQVMMFPISDINMRTLKGDL